MKVYLIDYANNKKNLGLFDTKQAALTYVNNKYLTTPDNLTKKEFFEQFGYIKKDVLEASELPKFGYIPLYYSGGLK